MNSLIVATLIFVLSSISLAKDPVLMATGRSLEGQILLAIQYLEENKAEINASENLIVRSQRPRIQDLVLDRQVEIALQIIAVGLQEKLQPVIERHIYNRLNEIDSALNGAARFLNEMDTASSKANSYRSFFMDIIMMSKFRYPYKAKVGKTPQDYRAIFEFSKDIAILRKIDVALTRLPISIPMKCIGLF